MSGEKILIVSDSLEGPTGFANNAAGVAWCLAKDYNVHVLGLQSTSPNIVRLSIEDDPREVFQHPNVPRTKSMWDFGARSLPLLLDELEPDLLLTLNDIQMISHIPNILYPSMASIKIVDLPSKEIISKEALIMELEGQIQRIKEKYARKTKWLLYGPQDGEPPMQDWYNIYSIADQVVAFCKYGQKIYKRYFNMDVPYIYHGVDSSVFHPMEREINTDKFVIGNFNRNQPRKQPVRTIQAFAKFAKDKDDVLLHMQMDWNDQFGWPLHYFVGLYGIGNKVIQPQRVGMPRNQVARTYSQWDLNVTPTGGEGFGLTELEGMACGVPNIATDYTSTRELTLDGNPSPRGTPVRHRELYWEKLDVAAVQRSAIDIDALADTFNKYYYDRELVKKHGENAAAWVKKTCTLKLQQKKWNKMVKTLLQKE